MSGGKKKRDELAKIAGDVEADRAVEAAIRAIVMRREGWSWGDIAERLGRSQIEVEELARIGYARLGEQAADELRTEVEDRIDNIVRKAHVDLALCESQGERTAIYRVLLAAEAQRSRLLGLNLKGQTDDE